MCPFQVAPIGGGISAAISRRLLIVAGPGPGFEPESPGKGECGGGHGKGAHPRRSSGRMRPAGGAGLAALCRRWTEAPAASGLVDARWVLSEFPAPRGLEAWMWGVQAPECRPHPDPIFKAGSGRKGDEEGWGPQKPHPHDLILNVNRQ